MLDDQNLVKGIKAGEPGVFKQLVEFYQARVLNTCYSFLHNREDAEEVAQDVFLEVHKSISGFRGQAKLSTWIYRISVTRSLDLIRKKKRKKRFGRFVRIIGLDNPVERVPAPRRSEPHIALEEEERFQVLKEAMDSLPVNQRIALTLSNFEKRSYSEIAEVLGTTVSAVESLIHRGKKNLRGKLYRYYKKQE